MKIKKIKETYNDYQCELSFGQLTAIRNALSAEHADPLADELFSELNWYLANIPGPGESEEDIKAQEQANASGMASPEAAQKPLNPQADDLLPAPGAEEGGEQPPGAEGSPSGEEGPPGPEGEADRRLPPPPEE